MLKIRNIDHYQESPWQYHQVMLLTLVAIAATTRIYDLDYLSLWSDELWGVIACSQGGLQAMINNLVNVDSHPPAYQTFLYYWMLAFGQSDFIIRLPSALAGIAAIPAIYKTGKDHFSITAGLIAATLMATSYQAIYYSQEARAYSMLLLMVCLHCGFLLRVIMDGSTRNRDRAGFILTAAALLYLHYAGAVLIFSEGLIFLLHFLCKPSRERFVNGTLVLSLGVALYAPWLPVMYKHATSITAYWSPKPGWLEFRAVWEFLAGRDQTVLAGMAALVALCCGFLIVRAALAKTDGADRKAFALLLLLVFPVAIFFAKSIFSQSIHTDRHFLYALPLIFLLIGHVISGLMEAVMPQKKLQTLLLTGMIAVFVVWQLHANTLSRLYKHNGKHDFRGAVNLVTQDKVFMDGERLLIASSDHFDHYLQRMGVIEKPLFYFMYEMHTDEIVQGIRERAAGKDFYFLDVQITADENELSVAQKHLDANFTRLCKSYLNFARVSKYRSVPASGNGPAGDQACPPVP